jgi:O-antigen ligase
LAWSAVIAVGVFQLSFPRLLIRDADFIPSLGVLAALSTVALLLDRRSVRLPRVPWTVVAFLGISSLSLLWSIDRSDTAQMTTLYACMTLIACVWVAHTDTQVLLRGVAWGGLLIAISVAVWIARDPAIYGGALTGHGVLLGPYTNRNSVSFALTLTLPATLMRTSRSSASLVEIGLTILVHLAGLVLSGSATGHVGAVAIVLAFVIIRVLTRFRGRGRAVGWSVAAIVVACLAIVVALWNQILGMLGRSDDLSGRLQLWAAVGDVWRERPLTGYGFGAVWQYAWLPLGRASHIQREIEKIAGFDAGQGHNVLFDLLPQLGLLGAVALVLLMGVLAIRGTVQLRHEPDAGGWAVLTFIALVIVGFTEAGLIRPLGWFLVVAATAVCRRPPGAVRRRRVEQPE